MKFKDPTKTKKHIYWFASAGKHCPSVRYRGIHPLNELEKMGFTYDLVMPNRKVNSIYYFFKIYFSILFFRKKNSTIVFQKIVSRRYYAQFLKLLLKVRKSNTLYDIDDAEYLRYPDRTLKFFLQNCSSVSVGSEALKKYVSQYQNNVWINTSPVYAHNHIKKNSNSMFHIGWVGDFGNGYTVSKTFSHKTSAYEILFPAIKKIKSPIQLTLIGVKREEDAIEIKELFAPDNHIKLTIPLNLNWEDDQWIYEEIAKFDIGVSPMVDHEFNRSKSAFKVKQYLSCGVPVVASDIGENCNFVIEGRSGILCHDCDDFYAGITTMMEFDSEERELFKQHSLNSKIHFSMDLYVHTLKKRIR